MELYIYTNPCEKLSENRFGTNSMLYNIKFNKSKYAAFKI